MADAAEDHLSKLMAGAIEPISAEMWQRLEGEISEKDALAIATALTKVAVESSRLGMIEVAAKLSEETNVHLDLDINVIAYDPWAERYGE